jgi:DnaJ-domain-containing protein 1
VRGDHIPERKSVPVEVGLINGGTLKGKLWVSAGKTLADTLNAAHAFLEFAPYGDERMHYLAKAHILTLSTIDIPKPMPLYERRGVVDADDPHRILGVEPGAAWHAVREAYLQLAKTYHPDRFAGVHLPEEVAEYMGLRARRINAAYALLEGSVRHAANGAATGCPAG